MVSCVEGGRVALSGTTVHREALETLGRAWPSPCPGFGTVMLACPMAISKDTLRRRETLLVWYRVNGRAFPWRSASLDPYVVLVSEVMLQQTQASRVAQRLPDFLAQFPTLSHLAAATDGTIIRAWQGMGYNSRALRLRDAARHVVERFGSVVPQAVDDLRTLPGIGAYASASIACFAWNVPAVVLDVNIRRVYSRWLTACERTTDVLPDTTLAAFAREVIPAKRAALWHHAVMDLGAMHCTARTPACTTCPVAGMCPSAGRMITATRPRKAEPSFRGEPDRLWRGRFVQWLRTHGEGTPGDVFRGVTGDQLSATDRPWMERVVAALERDGMVCRAGDLLRLPE